MNVGLTQSASDIIHEDSASRDLAVFSMFQKNYDIETAKFKEEVNIFKLPYKLCSTSINLRSKKDIPDG
eukprot:snap_masked-scaffold_50-processed-gene-0.30-mRNA-1 protein AED:1.00 eAED:1.00 QI:0/-1/0/0/-1/1/1/0/68